MLLQFWAGCHHGSHWAVARMVVGKFAELDWAQPDEPKRVDWRWGGNSPGAQDLASYLLLTAIGPQPDMPDLVALFTDKFVSQWGNHWHISSQQIHDWAEEVLCWELVEHGENLGEDG
jgi:hypothetical protein